MPTPTRDLPYVSVQVYNAGHGDPIVIEPGVVWYDVMEKSGAAGTPGVDGIGISTVEFISGVGVCCRAFLVPKDTLTTHGTTNGGTWESRILGTGRAASRISQIDTAATVTSWEWKSSQFHPANPQFAFSLLLPDTPADWDFSTYPPFIRVEWGNTYGVQFTKDGAYLMRSFGGTWTAVMSLPSPSRGAGYQDAAEIFVWVRVLRGKLLISFDGGNEWSIYAPAEGVSIPTGRIVLRGRGGAVTFGLHQLISYATTWDSAIRYFDRSRASATVTFDGSRYDAPTGTVSDGSVAFTDLGVPLARQMQYRATLTPAVSTGTLWNWYSSPVLYATCYRIAPTLQTTGSTKSGIWDEVITAFQVTKPPELAGATASFTIELDAYDTNTLDGYLWRKVELIYGYHLSDDTDETYTFVGYLEEYSAAWSEELSKVVVTWKIANASMRFRRNPWGPFLQSPLGGQTPNAAAAEIFTWHGLNSSYYAWHTGGSTVALPAGSPEEPCELCNITELPWETLTRIFDERYLEVGIADDATFFTLPKNYVLPGDAIELRSTPVGTSDEREQVSSATVRLDAKEGATAVICYGKDENDQFVFASAYDAAAETDTTSERFRPWRETVLREIPGTVTQGYLMGHAANLAQQNFKLKKQADVTIPIDPRRSRRELVTLYGFAGMGVTDGSEWVILTLQHSGQRQQGLLQMTTQAGLQRL